MIKETKRSIFISGGSMILLAVLCFFFATSAKSDSIDFCKILIKGKVICTVNQNDFGSRGTVYLEIPDMDDTLEIKYFSDTRGSAGHDFVIRDFNGKLLTSFTSDKSVTASYVPFLVPVKNLPMKGSTLFVVKNGTEIVITNIIILPRQ